MGGDGSWAGRQRIEAKDRTRRRKVSIVATSHGTAALGFYGMDYVFLVQLHYAFYVLGFFYWQV